MKIRGVLFDLYGTLFIYGDMKKAWDAWFHVIFETFSEQGLQLPEPAFRTHCRDFFEQPEPQGFATEKTVVEKRFQQLANELQIALPRTTAIRMIERSIGAWHEYVPIDPEAYPVLQEAARHRSVAVVSNFDYAPHIFHLLGQHELDSLLDAILVSDAVGVKKPDPLIFQQALAQLGLSPQETLHIGDSREDVEGALGVGIRPVWIDRQLPNGWQAEPWMPVTRITKLRQVLELLD